MSLVGCPNQILDWNFSHSYSVNAIKSSQLFNQKFWCHLDLILQQSLSVLLSKYKPSAYAGATIISYPDCYNVFLGDKPCFHLVILLTCMFSKASPPGVFRLIQNIVQPWPLKWLHSLHATLSHLWLSFHSFSFHSVVSGLLALSGKFGMLPLHRTVISNIYIRASSYW